MMTVNIWQRSYLKAINGDIQSNVFKLKFSALLSEAHFFQFVVWSAIWINYKPDYKLIFTVNYIISIRNISYRIPETSLK